MLGRRAAHTCTVLISARRKSCFNLLRWDFREVKAFILANNSDNLRGQNEDDFLKAIQNGANEKM